MERYQYSETERNLMERSKIPFAIYQFIDQRIVTLILSDGFCDLFGYDDRSLAYYDMDHNMYKDTHPDDVARIADAAVQFATKGEKYEVIYRSRFQDSADYQVIHATGKHFFTESGIRLAQVWYTKEGSYSTSDDKLSELNRSLNSALHEESILNASHYDYLTGLPSMTHFFALATAGGNALAAQNIQPALLFLDLRGMKYFNRRYGFEEGDRLLRAFAQLLVKYFSSENCCRIGQDHFALYTKLEGLEDILYRLFNECREINDGKSLAVHVGIYPKQEESVDVSTACDRAKLACDAIKNNLESAFNYFDTSLLTSFEHRQYIIDNLDRAIEEHWIEVYYQPIVRAVNGRVCNEEALARWIDPNSGLLPPSEFIPILEDARLIYELDLHVLDQVLDKLNVQASSGLHLVPQSINLSRADFDSCDMVEEIRKRVDAAGIGRDKISIEITESIIGSDFDFIKEQIQRFKKLGFPVWMDDFGSGYSSLDVLQNIKFDLIKFDMHFMRQFNNGASGRIILTELMKLATALGVETICEGVETEEQLQFLREIGCTKIQGFYYGPPIPMSSIIERYDKGIQIGFENPLETEYYETMGRINLYDLAVIAQDDKSNFNNFFNTLPMAIMEVRDHTTQYVRTNQSYRDFMQRVFGQPIAEGPVNFSGTLSGQGSSFLSLLLRCCETGNRAFIDEQLIDGSTVHSFIRRIAVNPVTKASAVVVVVLSIREAEQDVSYAKLARALAADYFNLFLVDLETEEYIEYTSNVGIEELAVETRGDNFFEVSRHEAQTQLYEEDRADFDRIFRKEIIIEALDAQGTFTYTYRLLKDGEPVYVNMKAMRMAQDPKHIILAVSNIDAQMKIKEAQDRLKRDQITFSRIMALSGDYICIYSVDPETDHYIEYSSSSDYKELGISTEGENFFEQSAIDSSRVIHPDDMPTYERYFNKKNILHEIKKNGFFLMKYRLNINGSWQNVSIRATLVHENNGSRLIFGVTGSEHSDLPEAQPVPVYETADGKFLDYQCFVNCVKMPSCVISVEKKPNGRHGDIRLICANQAYKDAMGPAYYDNMLYYELVPKDNKFEDYCYQAAVNHKRMHAYVEARALNYWVDQTMIPMESNDKDIGYCQFIFEMTEFAEASRMASVVTMDTAEAVIKGCIKLMGSDDFQTSAGEALDVIMEMSNAQAARIMLVDHEKKRAIKFSERLVEDAWENRNPYRDAISYDLISTWDNMIGVSNAVLIKDEHDMNELEPLNPEWIGSMRKHGVTSLVLIPLRRDKEAIGYLYVVNFDTSRIAEIKEVVELMAFFLGSEISNHLLMEKLEELSQIDILTTMKNRRAMSIRMKRIEESPEPVSFGIVNVDLNGLKVVNDRDGHEAGDRLLIQAAEVLQKVFYQDDVFRTGGDEFVVIISGISRETFERKLNRLKRDMDKNTDVSFAIGECWSDGSLDLTTAFRYADDRMYADKKAFYEKHPELKRS